MISVRQHWMALVRPGAIIMIILGFAVLWATNNPKIIVNLLHVTQHSAEYGAVREFYMHKWIYAAIPFGIALLIFIYNWLNWSIAFIEVDNDYIKYKLGPFSENRISLYAIQDSKKQMGLLGLIFGYGTLVIESGREVETLTYVPDINNFLEALKPRSFT